MLIVSSYHPVGGAAIQQSTFDPEEAFFLAELAAVSQCQVERGISFPEWSVPRLRKVYQQSPEEAGGRRREMGRGRLI